MGTVFNLAIIHFKYTFTFVIGVYAFELITKSLVSAIAGHLHIPDFWCKLHLTNDGGDEWEHVNQWQQEYLRSSKYHKQKIKELKNTLKKDIDIESRLGRYKK